MKKDFVFELCDVVRETGYAIHCYHGPGHLEKVYENALMHRLRKLGLDVKHQHPMTVYDEDGTILGEYFADLLVEDCLVVELKAARAIATEHIAQILGYLRASRKEHGVLLNFGAAKFAIKKYTMSDSSPLDRSGRFASLLMLLFLIFASLCVFCGPSNCAAERPNVLFIAVDDLRAELGCYGSPVVQSPNLDRLAARGTLFTRAYCQQAVCNPSRASLLTGLRPETLRLWDLPTHFRKRDPDVVTLPQHFKNHGYHAENIGKIFHNWRQDDHEGDPASWSVPAVMHYNTHGADKAVADRDGKLPPDLSDVPKCEIRDVPDEAYFDGRIAALAVEALGRLKAKGDPFFLAVGFWKPHAHFNAPKKYWDLYDRKKIPPPADPHPPADVPALALHDGREILRDFKSRPGGAPTAADARELRRGYYAAISYVDAQIGKVIDALDRLALAEDTIIAFWSDHGYHLGEHGLWAKTSNFELDARVPVIIAAPGHPAAQRTDSLVELLDLYPTLVELCGLPLPGHLEGVSLRPILSDPKAAVKDAAFTWHPRPAYPPDGETPEAMGHSLRTDRHRYTEWRDFDNGAILARELYDHDVDPGETKNLADRAEQAAIVEKLQRLFAERQAPAHPLQP